MRRQALPGSIWEQCTNRLDSRMQEGVEGCVKKSDFNGGKERHSKDRRLLGDGEKEGRLVAVLPRGVEGLREVVVGGGGAWKDGPGETGGGSG